MKIDHRSYTHNLSSCDITREKGYGEGEKGSEVAANDLGRLRIRLTDDQRPGNSDEETVSLFRAVIFHFSKITCYRNLKSTG